MGEIRRPTRGTEWREEGKARKIGLCVVFLGGEGGSWDERRESNEEQTKLDRGIYLASIIFFPPFLSCSLSPIRAKGGTRFSGKGVSKGQNQELIFPPRTTPGPEKGDERKNGQSRQEQIQSFFFLETRGGKIIHSERRLVVGLACIEIDEEAERV